MVSGAGVMAAICAGGLLALLGGGGVGVFASTTGRAVVGGGGVGVADIAAAGDDEAGTAGGG